jgi:hypothetical protein
MPTLPGLSQLTRTLLESSEAPEAAAWDILDLASRLADAVAADAIAVDDRLADAVAALTAGHAAITARDLLPLPTVGTPQPDPEVTPDAASELADALDLVRDRLDEEGRRRATEPDAVYTLFSAADRAGAAAAGLRRLWNA